MSVIDLSSWRAAAPVECATCSCGSVWFQPIRREQPGGPIPGAVQLTPDGNRVIAYVGVMECCGCGKQY